jgi:hypothetical protein
VANLVASMPAPAAVGTRGLPAADAIFDVLLGHAFTSFMIHFKVQGGSELKSYIGPCFSSVASFLLSYGSWCFAPLFVYRFSARPATLTLAHRCICISLFLTTYSCC